MKRIAFLVLLQIITVGAFSQNIQGSVMRSGSKLLDENRNRITYSQFGDYLEVNNPEAYEYFDKGVTQKTLGNTFAVVGGACLIGGVVTTLIDSKSITNLSIGLGFDICAVAFLITSIPLTVKGSRNISKSVNVYNQSVIEKKGATSEFRLNAKGNGLSLSYSF
jgi:hypothetical protein